MDKIKRKSIDNTAQENESIRKITQALLRSKIDNEVKSIMTNSNNRIDHIFARAKCVIREVLTLPHMVVLVANICGPKLISDEHVNDIIASLITFQYLYYWLENDPNSKQTIESFAMKKYVTLAESESCDIYCDIDPDEFDHYIARLKKAEKIYRRNRAMRNEQAKAEGDKKYRRAAYKTNGTIKYDFVTLCSLDFIQQDFFYLLKWLERKFGSGHRYKKIERLNYGYTMLDEMIHHISSIKSHKEFVISCFAFYEYENTYRFLLYARIAKYMKDHNIDINQQCPSLIEAFVSRDASMDVRCSPFITNYDLVIKSAFESSDGGFYSNFTTLIRYIFGDCFHMYISLYPIKELGTWTSSDYDNATEFLATDYNIFDSLNPLEINFSKENEETCPEYPSYFDYIMKMYQNNSYIDQSLLNIVWKKVVKKKDGVRIK